MSSFGLVSTQTQHFLASMLLDDAFTTTFLEESAMRLAERHKVFTEGLIEVGIHCLESNAGLFCWMDLRSMLKAATSDAEIELWRMIIDKVKLNVSPGTSFHCSEPGWFRVCFANIDEETMEIALGRIRSFVDEANRIKAQAKKKKSWHVASLRLSLSRRIEDVSIMSPHLCMSPCSPLIQAAT
uniref:1-aminocyclopropane-1-carboxylate synthase n=1 Tax=Narcissus tazetta subsp. chinensis TaxID=391288 RepID=A0A2Z2GQ15_NARTA|nr:ACC synthase [Narcissus tazetta subsp. chinensis]